jgi:hypothetical protein
MLRQAPRRKPRECAGIYYQFGQTGNIRHSLSAAACRGALSALVALGC